MIKKLLLQMLPPEKASREAVDVIRADKLQRQDYYTRNAYFYGPRARDYSYVMERETRFKYNVQAVIETEICDHILRLSVYSRYALHRGDLYPEVVVYIDKKERRWMNYFPETGKWTEAMIDTAAASVRVDQMTNGSYYGYLTKDTTVCIGAEKAVSYFETEVDIQIRDNAYDVALRWQQAVRAEQNERRKDARIGKWNRAMELIPPLPDDFEDWSFRDGMRKSNFLLRQIIPRYDQRRIWIGKYRYTCTFCGADWESNDPGKHNAKVECPFCDTKLVMKYWGRQKTLMRDEFTGIIQNYGEGFVVRKFYVKKVRRKENDYQSKTTFSEVVRMITDRNFNPIACYERDDRQGNYAVCWNPKRVGSIYQYPGTSRIKCFGYAVMYTGNLTEVFSGGDKWFQKLGKAGSLFYPGEGEEVYPVEIIGRMKELAYLEYVERAGLFKLSRQIFKHQWTKELNTAACRLTDLLGVSGNAVSRMKKWDLGTSGLEALRYVEAHGEKIGDEALKVIDEREIRIGTLQLDRTGMTLQQTVLYLYKMARRTSRSIPQTIIRYRDYLNLAEERGMDLHDDIVRRSSKMDELHDRWSAEKQAAKDADRMRKVDREYKTIAKDFMANQQHFSYTAAGLCIMVPARASDLIIEGSTLHHCVGASDGYMKKMNSHTTWILFLRKVGEENSPYYTLEVKWDGEILQAYSEFDRKPDYDNKIGPWLKRFQKAVRKRVEKEKAAQLLQQAI